MAGVQRSSGWWASRAVTTATSSASVCFTASGRRTWTPASALGGAVAARLPASSPRAPTRCARRA
eukprot:8616620-Alexandrium_andersonii.AAC.1